MRRAALYARVSTELQEKEQTIQSQLAAIQLYADEHGLRYSPALTYADDGFSGTWLDRPALDELRDHAKEGRFDVVVVLCPDRLARRYAYQVLVLDELKRAGIEIHFCERPINDNPDDQLLLQIEGAIAEYERAKLLDRCRRGRLHRARLGELAPPTTPFGYTYSARKYGGDGQIRIHEEEAAVVRQVFAWSGEGASKYEVLKRLNASPWKTRRGSDQWSPVMVTRMLRCEWYVGRAYYNRMTRRPRDRSPEEVAAGGPMKMVAVERPRSEWIEVAVPRIVDDEVFKRVQRQIEERQQFARRRLQRRHTYLLRGLLKCGMCGHAYTGLTPTSYDPGLPSYSYYQCSHRHRSLRPKDSERCGNDLLRAAGVDEVVWNTVRDLLLDSDTLAEQLRGWLESTTARSKDNERLQSATSRLQDLGRQRERLIDAYQAGALDLDDFQKRKTGLENRILAVEAERAELRSLAAQQELATGRVAGAEAVVASLRHHLADPTFEVKQAILRLVIDKVIITGHRLEIHLALPVSGCFSLGSTRGAKWSRPRKLRESRTLGLRQPRFLLVRFPANLRLPSDLLPR